MPLVMPDFSTERPQVIVFDPGSDAERAEAEQREEMLVRQGFRVRSRRRGKVMLQPPPRGETVRVLRVLTDNGDDRIVWDRTNPSQVRDAFKKFREFMGKGYRAYATTAGSKKGHRIDEFDPGLEEILLSEKEVTLVPPTVPG